ncbi:FAD-binding oxidoreductase [Microbacterium sp. C7(2022)]|uniref:FAD-binding oxidoreductase n=1 Tax=Microbacterium sp. C7(2022) TaxID=2992759 RepID=UPI00237AC29B|nr:FAD-linked oxidase C-terminal domain-containing protein [Microbacterium sp. C7(2022)]MDE0545856.1 FAD-binding protein [Microbacterium sp. C7(2022)]
MNDFLAALVDRVDAARIITDAEVVTRYSHDDAEWADYVSPSAVVCAESLDDVVATVRCAAEYGVAVVPRGAGTGLSGGANAVAGCVVLSLERMTAITEVNPDERYVVAEAGVLNDELRRHVADFGLWYPPDPASYRISTIGGNVATNAGGICCVKYGVTRDYVLGMTVVLADGRVARLGRKTAKGVTGFDLTGLMVGSEGALGVIVDVTLSLRPLSGREERGVVGYFSSLTDAGAAVSAVSKAGIVPSALELIDRTCLRAVAQWQEWDVPADAAALLLAAVDEPGAIGAGHASVIARLFGDAGATRVERADDAAAMEQLFLARRLAYPALERLGPVLTEDVCVPRAAVPEMLARIEATAMEHEVTIANIAHAGDGNLHPLIIAPVGDDAAKARAMRAFDRIVSDCRELGGTVTGEHGVGLLKLDGAREELSEVVLDMHGAIKHALDPRDLMNPGKAFPRDKKVSHQ